jgi:rfaE bifunctional protein nucleotidyltransferase chain/domain
MTKRNGHKVVMTNGCFDLLHAGHACFLSAALDASGFGGGRLVVGVNSDQSIKVLKSRLPAIPLDQRMYLLDALSVVSAVFSFDSEKELDESIAWANPDIYVDSAEHKSIDESRIEAIPSSCEIVHMNRMGDISTNSIIKRIRE